MSNALFRSLLKDWNSIVLLDKNLSILSFLLSRDTQYNVCINCYLAFSTQADVTLHFENNTPFLTVTEMTRVIEVSHWGNIAVEETLDLYHSGAVLKGSFSRYDYQRQQDGVSSVKSFKVRMRSQALTWS